MALVEDYMPWKGKTVAVVELKIGFQKLTADIEKVERSYDVQVQSKRLLAGMRKKGTYWDSGCIKGVG